MPRQTGFGRHNARAARGEGVCDHSNCLARACGLFLGAYGAESRGTGFPIAPQVPNWHSIRCGKIEFNFLVTE